MEGRLVQLDFSAAFEIVSHYGMLHKLRSTAGVGEQFLFIVLEFLDYRRQRRGRLDGEVSPSVNVISEVSLILLPLLFILYTSLQALPHY